jgi:hypothetical protein
MMDIVVVLAAAVVVVGPYALALPAGEGLGS